MPDVVTAKTLDFRIRLEIQSYALDCKQTDTNFMYYYI